MSTPEKTPIKKNNLEKQSTGNNKYTIERSTPSKSDYDKKAHIVNIVLQVINIIFGFAVMSLSILRFAGIAGAGYWRWANFGNTIITIYITFFGLMMIILCLVFPDMLYHFFGWYQQMLTRGLFYVFLGCIILSPGAANIIIGIFLIILGNYSNFVGAHYWNIQNELFNLFKDKGMINSDNVFRYGETNKGILTCCPRALVFDLSGTLGSLRKHGNIYDPSKEQKDDEKEITWHGKMQTIQSEEKPEKSKYVEMIDENKKYSYDEINEDLTNNCLTWSDFLEINYHPKSVSTIQNHVTDKFDDYLDGNLLSSLDFYDDTLDQIRFFLEECDSLQGFQFFSNTNDAWSKFSHDLNQLIRDEISTKYSIFTFGCDSNIPWKEEQTENQVMIDNWKRKLNTAVSCVDLHESSSVYIPLSAANFKDDSFKHIKFDPQNKYQTSAILASSIDSSTLAFRKKDSDINMDHVKRKLNVMNSMRLSSLCTSVPFPIQREKTFFEILADLKPIHSTELLFSLSPGMKRNSKNSDPYSKYSIFRGITSTKLWPKKVLNDEANDFYQDCKSHLDMFKRYNELTKSYYSIEDVFSQSSPTSFTFPNFFDKNIVEDGFIDKKEREQRVYLYPQMTNIQTTKELKPFIQENLNFLKTVRKNDFKLGYDELEEYKEHLFQLSDDYSQ
eukprot:gene5500-9317_t